MCVVPTVQPCSRKELRDVHELEQKSESKFPVQTEQTAASSDVLKNAETPPNICQWIKSPDT